MKFTPLNLTAEQLLKRCGFRQDSTHTRGWIKDNSKVEAKSCIVRRANQKPVGSMNRLHALLFDDYIDLHYDLNQQGQHKTKKYCKAVMRQLSEFMKTDAKAFNGLRIVVSEGIKLKE